MSLIGISTGVDADVETDESIMLELLFQQFDQDGDGEPSLSPHTVAARRRRRVMRRAQASRHHQAALSCRNPHFHYARPPALGYLDRTEFLVGFSFWKNELNDIPAHEKAKFWFTLFDKNRDG